MDIINFQNSDIRTVDDNGEFWYSVIDVVGALTASSNPTVYWNTLKHRLKKEGATQVLTNCKRLKLEAADGKMRLTDCSNRENLLRLIQSIPSSNVEPFKQWLANAGEQNIQETEDPSLLIQKFYDHWRDKGMSDHWIATRMRSIETRRDLTERWQDAGITESRDFAFLTNIISKGTFNLSVSEHKKLKGLADKHQIRDNMSPMELVYLILAEVTAKELSVNTGAMGYNENAKVAKQAGDIAGESRKRFEKKTGLKVVTPRNNLLE